MSSLELLNLPELALIEDSTPFYTIGDGGNSRYVELINIISYIETSLELGSMSQQSSANVNITGGSITGIDPINVADGGTGADNVVDARSNLGLGSVATQNSNAVSFTGGTITGITDLSINDGGTGASDAATARVNLGLEIGVNVSAFSSKLDELKDTVVTLTELNYLNGVTSNIQSQIDSLSGGSGSSDASDIVVDNSSFKVLTADNAQELWEENDVALLNARSTGIRYGGDLGDQGSGVVRITAGEGQLLDLTDPLNPVYNRVSWTQTDLDLSAVDGVYYVFVNSAGTVTTTTNTPSHADYRTKLLLHRVSIRGNEYSASTPIVQQVQQTGPAVWDIWRAIGTVKRGLLLSAVSTNLTVAVGAGEVYSPGAGFYNNANNPNEVDFTAKSPATFRLVNQNGDQSADTTTLVPGTYDNGGTLTAIPGASSRAQIFTVKMFPGSGGNIRIFYGQEFFNSVSDAQAALANGTYTFTQPEVYEEAVTLGWIIVEKGATDLSDGTQVFITSNIFGLYGGGTASSGVIFGLEPISSVSDTSTEGKAYVVLNNTNQVYGFGAGASLTGSAISCVAFGNNALSSHTSADGASAFGANALANSTGSQNTAVGDSSLRFVTTGLHNTAVGHRAGYNSTGSRNSILGKEALNNTTGSDNVAIGTQAAFTSVASEIVAIGAQAHRNGDGDGNIAVGYQSMLNSDGALQSVAIGYQALQNNTADQIIAIGYQALQENTTGTNNLAIGTLALTNNTTGVSNLALGLWALRDNVVGSYNTALGHYSMHQATGGERNTGVGSSTLALNVSGDDNTAVGSGSLGYNNTGSFNTSVGSRSLFSNTSGHSNTALGYETLNENIVGFQCTAIGLRSLKFNLANNNTALGADSLRENTSGSENTAIGAGTLISNLTGGGNVGVGVGALANSLSSDNTVIGATAGSTITTGENNVLIGRDSDVSSSGVNNAIAIGHSVVAGTNQIVIGNASHIETKLFGDITLEGSSPEIKTPDNLSGVSDSILIQPGLSTQTENGNASQLKIKAGNGNRSGGVVPLTRPGDLILEGGDQEGDGLGGTINITSGLAAGTTTSRASGTINIKTALGYSKSDANPAGDAGPIVIEAADGGANTSTGDGGVGGSLTLRAGSGGASTGGSDGVNGVINIYQDGINKVSLTDDGVSINDVLQLDSVTFANLPPVPAGGNLIYISNGATGNPALGISDGTNWKVLDLSSLPNASAT